MRAIFLVCKKNIRLEQNLGEGAWILGLVHHHFICCQIAASLFIILACYDTDADIQQIAPTSAEAQMTMYLNLCSQQRASEDCLEFWRKHERDLNKLYRLAMTVLSVPATSAAVEHVFSNGGLIMKPYRARMSDMLLWDLTLEWFCLEQNATKG